MQRIVAMKNKLISTVLYATGGTVILSAAALQTVAALLCFDKGSNYFITGETLPTVALILALIGGAVGILAACLSPRADAAKGSPLSASVYSMIPTVAAFLLFGVILLACGQAIETARALRVPAALLSVAAAAYVILSSLPRFCKQNKSAVTLLGFTAPLACALANAYYYFDLSVEMNSPVKYCVQVPLLFAMLYFLGELRYLIGEPKPRLFLAGACLTVASASLCAVAFPIAFFAGAITRFDYVMGAFLMLGICVGIGFRASPVLKTIVIPAPRALEILDTQEDDRTV